MLSCTLRDCDRPIQLPIISITKHPGLSRLPRAAQSDQKKNSDARHPHRPPQPGVGHIAQSTVLRGARLLPRFSQPDPRLAAFRAFAMKSECARHTIDVVKTRILHTRILACMHTDRQTTRQIHRHKTADRHVDFPHYPHKVETPLAIPIPFPQSLFPARCVRVQVYLYVCTSSLFFLCARQHSRRRATGPSLLPHTPA